MFCCLLLVLWVWVQLQTPQNTRSQATGSQHSTAQHSTAQHSTAQHTRRQRGDGHAGKVGAQRRELQVRGPEVVAFVLCVGFFVGGLLFVFGGGFCPGRGVYCWKRRGSAPALASQKAPPHHSTHPTRTRSAPRRRQTRRACATRAPPASLLMRWWVFVLSLRAQQTYQENPIKKPNKNKPTDLEPVAQRRRVEQRLGRRVEQAHVGRVAHKLALDAAPLLLRRLAVPRLQFFLLCRCCVV